MRGGVYKYVTGHLLFRNFSYHATGRVRTLTSHPRVRAVKASVSQQREHQPAPLGIFAEVEGVKVCLCLGFSLSLVYVSVGASHTAVSELTSSALAKTAKPPIGPHRRHCNTQNRRLLHRPFEYFGLLHPIFVFRSRSYSARGAFSLDRAFVKKK